MTDYSCTHADSKIQVRAWTNDDGGAVIIVQVPPGLAAIQREGISGGLAMRALMQLYEEEPKPECEQEEEGHS